MVRRPGEWADAQGQLREQVQAGDVVSGRPVWVVWWTAAIPLAEGGETWVAVYPPSPTSESEPLSIFPVGSQRTGDGEAAAVLLGESGMNAACGVEFAGRPIVWPTYNPVVGGKWAPRPGASGLAGGSETGDAAESAPWLAPALKATAVVAGVVSWVAAELGALPVVARLVYSIISVLGLVAVPMLVVRWRLRRPRARP